MKIPIAGTGYAGSASLSFLRAKAAETGIEENLYAGRVIYNVGEFGGMYEG